MIKVATFGVFDLLNIGHLNLLEKCGNFGDYLIVAVHDDVHRSKGIDFFYSLENRMRMVGALRCVDEVIAYRSVDQTLATLNIDIFAHGPDQNHSRFQKAKESSKNKGVEVIEINRTDGVSSSQLRKYVNTLPPGSLEY
jgi:glycerol-3-phosphate cytidylyltransferase